jgi:hypothetical protein
MLHSSPTSPTRRRAGDCAARQDFEMLPPILNQVSDTQLATSHLTKLLTSIQRVRQLHGAAFLFVLGGKILGQRQAEGQDYRIWWDTMM